MASVWTEISAAGALARGVMKAKYRSKCQRYNIEEKTEGSVKLRTTAAAEKVMKAEEDEANPRRRRRKCEEKAI
jgi:hypothetical protein